MMPSVPSAESFNIYYYLTDEKGNRGQYMSQQYFSYFFNQARCECGLQLQANIIIKSKAGMAYNQTTIMDAFVGTSCATAELSTAAQFKKCAKLESGTTSTFIKPGGVTANFHPIWLAAGIDPSAPNDRNPSTGLVAGTCNDSYGASGVWVCAQSNTLNGCQADEFIINGNFNNNLGTTSMSNMTAVSFDFLPPVILPSAIDSAAGDEVVVVSWTTDLGDAYGFRVLCEEADTGKPPPGNTEAISPPALNKNPDGTLYYTKNNLCPKGPFSPYTPGPSAFDDSIPGATSDTANDTAGDSIGDSVGDATTNDSSDSFGTTGGVHGLLAETTGTTGTTDADTTSATGTSETDGTTGATGTCGNLIVESGEECDDGNANNGPGKKCNEACTLNVCGDGDKGPSEQCDDGKENGDDALCGTDCVLHISDGMRELDWSYVCSPHLSASSRSVRITGLENDKRYNFMLVSYDRFGNPAAFTKLVTATPIKTFDVWDQCHDLGDVCGESGFCNVAGDGDPLLGFGGLLGLGLGFAGLRRRKRNSA